MASIYFVEITPVEGQMPDKLPGLLSKVESIVKKHTTYDTMRFKIFGENKWIFIAKDNEPEIVIDHLNKGVGGLVNVKCTPLRHYEEWAQTVLGVEPDLCKPDMSPFDKPQKLIFTHVSLEHPGLGIEDFLKIWKEEAEGGLTARSKGQLDLRFFKVLTDKAVVIFFNTPTASDVDGAIYQLPLHVNAKTSSWFKFQIAREIRPF